MRYLSLLVISAVIAASTSCSERVPQSPVETFKTYTKALKKKDATTMKQLLSTESLKAYSDEAKAMNSTVDDIVKREALIGENQTSVEFRDEKIEGDKATLQVKVFSRWETIFFVREEGEWKIDKKGSADQLLREIEEENRKADERDQLGADPLRGTTLPTPADSSNSNVNGF